jgi:soluble lytic murein transglycosylase-like protein
MPFKAVNVGGVAAIKDFQRLLNLLTAGKLKVDGDFGPKTQSAIGGLNASQRLIFRSLEKARLNVSPPLIVKASTSSRSDLAIRSAIIAECIKMGVNPDLALTIVSAESKFDPEAGSNTGASGLFQLTYDAVRDVAEQFSDSPSGSWFRSAKNDRKEIAWNIAVGVRYILLAARYAKISPRSSSVEDWSKIYACYNVGIGTYRLLLAGKFDDPKVIKAVGQQASTLKRGGTSMYLTNALSYISSNVQKA